MLGLGLQNLTVIKDKDVNDAEEILRTAIDNGVNFIYSGYSYEETTQEEILRMAKSALTGDYRQKVKLAISIPVRLIEDKNDFEEILHKQLDWLGERKVDLCVLDGLNRYSWPRMQSLNIAGTMDKIIAENKVDKLGFFFHDHFQTLRDVVESYNGWSVCGFQYSYMDSDHHPGYGGLKYAADKELGVFVTEPHLGGRLTSLMPDSVRDTWEPGDSKYSRSEWAVKWVWNHDEVATAVSNMSSMEQMSENLVFAETAEAGVLNIRQQIFISKVRDAYRKLKPLPCTTCRACMPCPQGIDVPRVFEIFNDAIMYNDIEIACLVYRREEHRLENCTECGMCAKTCGKQIPIPEWLKKAQNTILMNMNSDLT